MLPIHLVVPLSLLFLLFTTTAAWPTVTRISYCCLTTSQICMASAASSPEPPQDEVVVGQMLGGLTFYKTRMRPKLVEFYTKRVGMSVWLEQPDITILSHGNLLIGFHQISAEHNDTPPEIVGCITLVYPSADQVDAAYRQVSDVADGPPRHNARYRIYQFFGRDPEGRLLEWQAFLHPLTVVTSAPSHDGTE